MAGKFKFVPFRVTLKKTGLTYRQVLERIWDRHIDHPKVIVRNTMPRALHMTGANLAELDSEFEGVEAWIGLVLARRVTGGMIEFEESDEAVRRAFREFTEKRGELGFGQFIINPDNGMGIACTHNRGMTLGTLNDIFRTLVNDRLAEQLRQLQIELKDRVIRGELTRREAAERVAAVESQIGIKVEPVATKADLDELLNEAHRIHEMRLQVLTLGNEELNAAIVEGASVEVVVRYGKGTDQLEVQKRWEQLRERFARGKSRFLKKKGNSKMVMQTSGNRRVHLPLDAAQDVVISLHEEPYEALARNSDNYDPTGFYHSATALLLRRLAVADDEGSAIFRHDHTNESL